MALINRVTTVPGVTVTDTSRPTLRDFAAELRAYNEFHAWWDFAAARITPDIGTTPGTTRIAAVGDKSGHGRTLVQNTAAKRPIWVPNALNGRPVALFDLIAGYRLDGVGLYPSIGDHTTLVISKLADPAAAVQHVAGSILPATNRHQMAHTTPSGGIARYFARNGDSPQISPAIGSGELIWQVYIMAQDATNGVAYLKIGNIMDVISAPMVVSTPSPDIFIGQNNSGAQNMGGQIAEVMVFSCNLLALGYAVLLGRVQAYILDAYGDL